MARDAVIAILLTLATLQFGDSIRYTPEGEIGVDSPERRNVVVTKPKSVKRRGD